MGAITYSVVSRCASNATLSLCSIGFYFATTRTCPVLDAGLSVNLKTPRIPEPAFAQRPTCLATCEVASEIQVRAVVRSEAHSFRPLTLTQRQFNRPLFLKQLCKRVPGGDCVRVPQQLADRDAWVAAFKTPSCAARDAGAQRRIDLSHLFRSAQSSTKFLGLRVQAGRQRKSHVRFHSARQDF